MINFIKKNTKKLNINKQVKIFGKNIDVKVIYSKIKNPELIATKKTIDVYLPYKYKKMKDISIVELALQKMYDEIARVEIEKVMEETRVMLHGLAPDYYEIRRIPNKFSKNLPNKTIIINPEIIQYDKQVLKYVILSEFCHLKYKTNCKGFFEMISKYMKNYEEYSGFLNVA